MTWNFVHFIEIDSTNLEACRRIKANQAQVKDVIYADIQTASYGRRGRPWQSAKGNLLATLIIKKPEKLNEIPFVFGLALLEGLDIYADKTQVLKLKWPNDVLLNEAKLAGVLLEVEGDYLTIGMGVNLAVAPSSDQPVATLNSIAAVQDVLHSILARFDYYLSLWDEKGFDPIRQSWLRKAHGLGQKTKARFPDGTEKTGIFKNIGHDGALIIEQENQETSIATADIFFET